MQIRIKDIDLSEPYSEFVRRLNEAIDNSQQNVEAMCISSFNKDTGEVDSRYVNLKVIEKNNLFFLAIIYLQKLSNLNLSIRLLYLFFGTLLIHK